MKIPRLTALLLMGSLAAFPLQSQDLDDLYIEKNQFRYIPKGEFYFYTRMMVDGIDKIFTVYWYDRNHNEKVEEDEMFIDVNGDDIPDMLLSDFIKWYDAERTKRILRETTT